MARDWISLAVLALSFGAFLPGCASTPARARTFLTIEGQTEVEWSAEDQRKDIAVRTLRVTETASYHVVRLAGSEKPHLHQNSDLTVTVLSGKVRMNLGSQIVTVLPGQVIDIPRGTFHFAENIDDGPSEAYVVFSPPADKSDNVPAERPTP